MAKICSSAYLVGFVWYICVVCQQYDKQDETYTKTLKYLNWGFTGMFTVECILKILAFGVRVRILQRNIRVYYVFLSVFNMKYYFLLYRLRFRSAASCALLKINSWFQTKSQLFKHKSSSFKAGLLTYRVINLYSVVRLVRIKYEITFLVNVIDIQHIKIIFF